MNSRTWRSLVVGLALAGCPKQVPIKEPEVVAPPPPVEVAKPVEPTGPGLIIHVEPDDAEVIIDGASLGIASQLTLENGLLPLRPGIYQVNLKRSGFVSWRAEVTVNDKPEKILVTLQKP